jgi:transglutaminase-like putative cysteine protease
MQVLRVRHITRYRYARPVQFGEHRMMLRPRERPDQTVVLERLVVTPTPIDLTHVQDSLGNWIGVARFEGAARELCFASEIEVVQRPPPPPAVKSVLPRQIAPQPDAEALAGHPEGAVVAWAQSFLARPTAEAGVETLMAINRTLHADFRYRKRLEHGVQPASRTLALRSGACRDLAMLLVAAARALGLQARFVSGYVHCPTGPRGSRAGTGHTHAWASVLTPGCDWLDFDPTSGAVGSKGLIAVAAADDPVHATPLQGTYFGAAADFLGMDVEVHVQSKRNSTIGAAWGEPEPFRRVAWSAA